MPEISTYKTKFEYGVSEDTMTAVRVRTFPEVSAKRSSIEVTDFDDDAKRYIPGIRETPEGLDFGANYDPAVITEIEKLADNTALYQKLTFSDGSGYSWQGALSCALKGGNVNEAVQMTLSSIPSTVPQHFASST